MVKHTFTWIKVMAIAFVVFIAIGVLVNIGNDQIFDSYQIFLFLEGSFWLSLFGVIIGFVINLFTNFRKAALCYACGHTVVVLGIVCFLFFGQKSADPNSNFDNWNTEFSRQGRANKEQLDLIGKRFSSDYPDQSCFVHMILVTDKNDSMCRYFFEGRSTASIYGEGSVYRRSGLQDTLIYSVLYKVANYPDELLFSEYRFLGKNCKVLAEGISVDNPNNKEHIRKRYMLVAKELHMADSIYQNLRN